MATTRYGYGGDLTAATRNA